MPAVNDVGEPCAGEPHARFDGRELETEHAWPRPPEWDSLAGNRRNTKASGPTARTRHRASSRPSMRIEATRGLKVRKCLSCKGNLGLRRSKNPNWKALRR